MPLSDIVNVSITGSSSPLSLPGFGTPAILGAYAKTWTERIRYYTSLVGVAADFATTDPEYKAAVAVFSQNPRPVRLAILRGTLKPTQAFKITVAAVKDSTAYGVRIGPSNVGTFTSGVGTTNDLIAAGLVAAINALTGDNLTAAATGTAGSQVVTLTGVAGSWDPVEVLDVGLLSVEQNHADPGVATDLAAIQLYNPDWYAIVYPWNSKACVQAIAAWAESNDKLYAAASSDTPIITTAEPGATDIAKLIKTSAYNQTAVFYHPATDAFLDAAVLGACLPLDPGTETWWGKTLSGPAATSLTATHQTNLDAKLANYYYSVASRNITAKGRVAGTLGYIDVTRGLAALKVDMQSRVFLLLANAKKIPFTDAGAMAVRDQVKASLDKYTGSDTSPGLLSPGTVTVTVPKVSTVSAQDKANRNLPGVTFAGTLSGALQGVTINGVVSV